jgi:hypothetical protein
MMSVQPLRKEQHRNPRTAEEAEALVKHVVRPTEKHGLTDAPEELDINLPNYATVHHAE